ncbi:MAG: glycosyltransferase [Burkholderiales bacterium]|nr:glycosyltransferase [Burkholderiales bacterium]
MPIHDVPRQTNPLRVGYVLKRFPRLSQTFVLAEILELERRGVDVRVASLLPALDDAEKVASQRLRARVDVLSDGAARWPSGRWPDGLAAGKTAEAKARLAHWSMALAELWANEQIDCLHAHFGSDATTVALTAGHTLGRPVSFTAHARDIFKRYASEDEDLTARRTKIALADAVFTVSDFNRSYLSSIAGPGQAGKIERIYNGIDLASITPGPVAQRERGLILAVGRLIEKKGFRDLIAACAVLRSQGVDFRCDIVGDGPLRESLKEQARALGLERDIAFVGAVPAAEVLSRMQSAAAFALPCVVAADGDRDGLPTVLLEALASGLPAVTTNVAGTPEIIADGVTGRLVEPSSCRQLADALANVLTRPALAERFGREGRAKAERDFDITSNVGALHDLFARYTERFDRRTAATLAAE